jgi:hypothetical protein
MLKAPGGFLRYSACVATLYGIPKLINLCFRTEIAQSSLLTFRILGALRISSGSATPQNAWVSEV